MKAVCPDLIEFAYVPTASLHSEESDPKRRRTDDDLYELPGQVAPQYTLLFEFTDRSVDTSKATGKRVLNVKRGASQKETIRVIGRRNDMFERAMNTMLCACEEASTDPLVLVMEAAQNYVPVRPGEVPLDHERRTQRERLDAWALDPASKPSVAQILAELKEQPWWREQIVPGGRRTFPARPAVYLDPEPALDDETATALKQAHGISQLYRHQAFAVNAYRRGENVVVCTGTSSGKSLVYQIPIASALSQDPEATAMCIFPTKALSQDQLQSMHRLFFAYTSLGGASIATYDGDTPREERRAIRESVRVLFTNPDMLHQSILPHEEMWRRFFRGLRIVVVDELHVYSGIFGTHVALILRRLRRVCTALGNPNVQFVSCSATIANPATHMASLLALSEDSIAVVDEDGSPCGCKEWAVWNPPEIDPDGLGGARVSSYTEVSQLFRHLILHGLRTIVFAKVRRTCEIIVRQVREDLARDGHTDLAQRVHGYRSGYSAADRRQLEQQMFSGDILGLVATSALELGVDIGSLDAVIMFGMPYSAASMWQQAGRAGRRQHDALVVLLAEPFSVDQYYMRNPELIFTQPHAPLWVDTQNEFVLSSHIQCAALEVPIEVQEDTAFFGPRLDALALQQLEKDAAGFYHYTDTSGTQPAKSISIRGARQETYKYVDTNTGAVLEEVEVERVFFEAFQGAVFLHQGTTYICQDVLHDHNVALLARADVMYHTRPRDLTDTDATQTWRIRTLEHAHLLAYYGQVTLTSRVWGYYKVDRRANILDTVEVDSPPMVRSTKGLWIDVPWSIIEQIAEHGINAPAAIHAAEHAILSLTPLFVASGSDDVRTECKVPRREIGDKKQPTQRKRPSRLIFYDKPGNDAGICAQVFQHLDALLRIALSVIEKCPCPDGCPGCIETPSCAGDAVSSKVGAGAVLRGLLDQPVFGQHDPVHYEEGHAARQLGQTDALLHTLCSPEPVPMRDDSITVEQVVEEAMVARPWPRNAHR